MKTEKTIIKMSDTGEEIEITGDKPFDEIYEIRLVAVKKIWPRTGGRGSCYAQVGTGGQGGTIGELHLTKATIDKLGIAWDGFSATPIPANKDSFERRFIDLLAELGVIFDG